MPWDQELRPPESRCLQKEFQAAYNTQPADLSLFNPSSYASFAAHIANGGDPPIRFGLGPGARRL